MYVSPRVNFKYLIFDGPELGDQPTSLLTSHSLADIEDSWEMPLLRDKQAEWPALRLNARQALRRLARFVPAPGRLLDFGCGGGFFLGAAAEDGWETFGLEPLPGHAVYARARFGAHVIADTLRRDSFPFDFFDAVTAFQMFEHLPDPLDALRTLTRFLKPGGVVLIEVPNFDTWSVRWLGPRHRHFVEDHLYFFSARTLGGLMQKAGLEPLEAYCPKRLMSVRHLLEVWGARILPGPLARLCAFAARRARLWERVVAVGLGDIVAVVGRRVEDGLGG